METLKITTQDFKDAVEKVDEYRKQNLLQLNLINHLVKIQQEMVQWVIDEKENSKNRFNNAVNSINLDITTNDNVNIFSTSELIELLKLAYYGTTENI